jgi:hypothetical protein
LICASAMVMMMVMSCNGVRGPEKNYVTVEFKWDKECLREGDSETSRDKLLRSEWNSNKHEQGIWWENVHHMAKTAKDL